MGVSGRVILMALISGTTDLAVLAELARGRLRKKLPALTAGPWRDGSVAITHFSSSRSWRRLIFLDEYLERLTTEIDQRLVPFERMLANPTIPGVDSSAVTIVAETGGDMSRFPTAGHLCS